MKVSHVHHVTKIDHGQFQTPAGYDLDSKRYRRQTLVDGDTGSVHMGLYISALDRGGSIGAHVHSYEESFFVLEGRGTLTKPGEIVELGPGDCGLIPIGAPHAWVAHEGPVRWLEMVAPSPRPTGHPFRDTFFLGEEIGGRATQVDLRDPRNRHFFRHDPRQLDIDLLRQGSRVDAPDVSASMSTALLVYSGIGVQMLVDQRLDAQLLTMFMVEYSPTGVAHPHDHPFEEAYLFHEGEVEAVVDDQTYVMGPGDVLWAGVGTVHAFYNRTNTAVKWIETQAPQPPDRHSYRFTRDWRYLEDRLRDR